MATRIVVLTLCFLATAAYLTKASQAEPTLARERFSRLPMQIATWEGRDFDLDERVLKVLGVDDYINRTYNSAQLGPLHLYAGFYGSQRQGATMHSPLNCLPGAGWNPTDRSYLTVSLPAESAGQQDIRINRIVIEKGMDKQIVLYWYQAHGRIVASEYWGKIYTVLDAVRLNRTDGAMVRVVVPVIGQDKAAERAAENAGVTFVQSVFPLLSRFLPE